MNTDVNKETLLNSSITLKLTDRESAITINVTQALEFATKAMRQRHIQRAEFIAKQIIESVPSLEEAYSPLLQIYYHTAQYLQLEKVSLRAVEHCPDFVEGHLMLSYAHKHQQKHGEAQSALEKAYLLDPQNPEINNEMGSLYKQAGHYDKALSAFNRCIELAPQLSSAYLNRADLYKEISDKEIQQIKDLLQNKNLPNVEKANLFYALARAYEFRKDYDQCFDYLTQGAQCKRASLDYNHAHEMREYDDILNIFSTSSPTQEFASTSKVDSDSPIFICGLPRSGTTLVEQILSSHEKVSAGEELFELAAATGRVLEKKRINKPYPHWIHELNSGDWTAIGEMYLEATKAFQSASHFTDKMPLNFKAIGIIHHALPNAKIIHCRRHPMDTILGCYKQMFASGIRFSYDLDELTDTYIAYHNTMEHWKTLYPNKILDVKYEDIVNNQEDETRRMLEFLGLPWSDDCVNYHQNKRVIYTISNSQVRQPLFKSALGRWKKFENFLAPVYKRLEKYCEEYE